MEKQIKNKLIRVLRGAIVSTAMSKTIVVRVDRVKMHPKYRKQYTVSRRYHVHDEKGLGHVGDRATFIECRPLSKTKRWRVIEVISHKA